MLQLCVDCVQIEKTGNITVESCHAAVGLSFVFVLYLFVHCVQHERKAWFSRPVKPIRSVESQTAV